jgi:hypothetical protein
MLTTSAGSVLEETQFLLVEPLCDLLFVTMNAPPNEKSQAPGPQGWVPRQPDPDDWSGPEDSGDPEDLGDQLQPEACPVYFCPNL